MSGEKGAVKEKTGRDIFVNAFRDVTSLKPPELAELRERGNFKYFQELPRLPLFEAAKSVPVSNDSVWSRGKHSFSPPKELTEQAVIIRRVEGALTDRSWEVVKGDEDESQEAYKQVTEQLKLLAGLRQLFLDAKSEWDGFCNVATDQGPALNCLLSYLDQPPPGFEESVKVLDETQRLVTEGECEAATGLLMQHIAKMTRFIKEHDKFHQDLETEDGKFLVRLAMGRPNQLWGKELAIGQDIMKQQRLGKYGEANELLRGLLDDISQLKKIVAVYDQGAEQCADVARKKVLNVGEFTLPESDGEGELNLNEEQLQKLVAGLKKLELGELVGIVDLLHGPSSPLSEVDKMLQALVYVAMELDPGFKKADGKHRETYQDAIGKDVDLKELVIKCKNGGDDKDREAIVGAILKHQCNVLKVPPPKVTWFSGVLEGFGLYKRDTKCLEFNSSYAGDPKELIDTVIHECTHYYQHDLETRVHSEKLTEPDPLYKQALAFAKTSYPEAYIAPEDSIDIDGVGAYEKQPIEEHAFLAGREGAKALFETWGLN